MNGLESLEARWLMAADLSTGLDAHFGRSGVLNFAAATKATLTGRVASGSDGYFFAATTGKRYYVYKVTNGGKIDTAWGSGGRLTFGRIPIDQIAVDQKTGKLYIAGVDFRSMVVERFNANGTEDATFGSGSVFNFTPTQPANGDSGILGDISAVTPLAHQQVLVTFNRRTYVETDTSGIYSHLVGSDELVVMRLRTGGTRDPNFGKNGFATVFGGAYTYGLGEFASTEITQTPLLGGIQLHDDGSIRVVGSQQYTQTGESNCAGLITTSYNRFQVVSRTLDINGKGGSTWTEQYVGDEPGDTRDIKPFYVGPVGDDDFSANIMTGGDPVAMTGLAEFTRFYAVGGDNPPSNTVLPIGDPGALTDFIRTARGDYFAFTSSRKGTARQVTKFTDALTVNRRWGRNGVTFLDDVALDAKFFGDTAGRLLVIDDGSTIRRFDGI